MSSSTQPRVLLVDDEPAVCHALGLLLSRRGLDVLTATSADAARDIVSERRPDVLVIDLILEGRTSGEDLFAAARAIDPGYGRRALFMTGDISERSRKRLADTGRPFLIKPFSAETLLEVVRALADDRPIPIPRTTILRREQGSGTLA